MSGSQRGAFVFSLFKGAAHILCVFHDKAFAVRPCPDEGRGLQHLVIAGAINWAFGSRLNIGFSGIASCPLDPRDGVRGVQAHGAAIVEDAS